LTLSEYSQNDMRLVAIRRLAGLAPALRRGDEIVLAKPEVLAHLVGAARRKGTRSVEEFQRAVELSTKVLAPLAEPLTTLDFAGHRWVAGHREEAYSDWLQWIVAQASAGEVLDILGVDDPELEGKCSGATVTVTRERCVPEGHEGSSGRLDLEIWLGDAVSLVIEVKVVGAEDADTQKGAGYCRSVQADRYIILVLEAEDDEYYGFKPRLWADVCVQLRLIAVRLCKRKEHLRAAMMLGFTTAVEQNLLKLRPECRNELAAALSLPPITDHLTQFLEAFEHAEEDRQ
jgi:hypothetical protein